MNMSVSGLPRQVVEMGRKHFESLGTDKSEQLLKAWSKLSLQDVRLAKTESQIRMAWWRAPKDSRADKLAVRKIHRLGGSI